MKPPKPRPYKTPATFEGGLAGRSRGAGGAAMPVNVLGRIRLGKFTRGSRRPSLGPSGAEEGSRPISAHYKLREDFFFHRPGVHHGH